MHGRIASPTMQHCCYYGVDTSSKKDLISAKHSVDEVCEIIGADSLAFLSVESLYKAAKRTGMCAACFDGKYPTELYSIKQDEE